MCVCVNIPVSELNTTPYVPLLDVACITQQWPGSVSIATAARWVQIVGKVVMVTASHSLLPPSGVTGYYKNKGEIFLTQIDSEQHWSRHRRIRVCSMNVLLSVMWCTLLRGLQRHKNKHVALSRQVILSQSLKIGLDIRSEICVWVDGFSSTLLYLMVYLFRCMRGRISSGLTYTNILPPLSCSRMYALTTAI